MRTVAIAVATVVALGACAGGDQPQVQAPVERVQEHPDFPHRDPEAYGVDADGHNASTGEQAAIDHWAFCIEDRWGRVMDVDDPEFQRIDADCRADAGL